MTYNHFVSFVADGFLGDIALPNIRYELEYDLQKMNKSLIEEIEKYRKEVLHEGLQVEEEGLMGLQKKMLTISAKNGSYGILKDGQERAKNRILMKPKNKTEFINTKLIKEGNIKHKEPDVTATSPVKLLDTISSRNKSHQISTEIKRTLLTNSTATLYPEVQKSSSNETVELTQIHVGDRVKHEKGRKEHRRIRQRGEQKGGRKRRRQRGKRKHRNG